MEHLRGTVVYVDRWILVKELVCRNLKIKSLIPKAFTSAIDGLKAVTNFWTAERFGSWPGIDLVLRFALMAWGTVFRILKT